MIEVIASCQTARPVQQRAPLRAKRRPGGGIDGEAAKGVKIFSQKVIEDTNNQNPNC